MSQYLPVRVFGDPMQGIFSFAGKLVDWGNLEYPIVKVATEPWRWKKTNPALGNYLTSVREQLMPILSNQSCAIRIDSNNQNINIIHISKAQDIGSSHGADKPREKLV